MSDMAPRGFRVASRRYWELLFAGRGSMRARKAGDAAPPRRETIAGKLTELRSQKRWHEREIDAIDRQIAFLVG